MKNQSNKLCKQIRVFYFNNRKIKFITLVGVLFYESFILLIHKSKYALIEKNR